MLWLFAGKKHFCQHLKHNNSLQSLGQSDLDKEFEVFFAELAEVLENHNTTLTELEYEECDKSGWGPSSVRYFLALNERGRYKLCRGDARTGNDIVDVLAPVCASSSWGALIMAQAQMLDAMDETKIEIYKTMVALSSIWAYSEEEWKLKDTSMLYGLLPKCPGGWSKAAAVAADFKDSKPAAKSPPTSVTRLVTSIKRKPMGTDPAKIDAKKRKSSL